MEGSKFNSKRVIIREEYFLPGTVVKLHADVYDLTIGANITKNVSPIVLNYCLKQCMFVFVV